MARPEKKANDRKDKALLLTFVCYVYIFVIKTQGNQRDLRKLLLDIIREFGKDSDYKNQLYLHTIATNNQKI